MKLVESQPWEYNGVWDQEHAMRRKFRFSSSIGIIVILTLTSLGCATVQEKPEAVPEPIPGLEGQWIDPETNSVHTILWDGDGYTVASCRDEAGDELPIVKQTWRKGVLSWTYHVPSTGYTVTFTIVSLKGDALRTKWSGTAGSGTETLMRIRAALPENST
jgi:hypothetical protein